MRDPTIGDLSVRLRGIIRVFFFLCVFFFRVDVRWSPNKIKAHKKVPKHA